jgi:hypothetical protein
MAVFIVPAKDTYAFRPFTVSPVVKASLLDRTSGEDFNDPAFLFENEISDGKFEAFLEHRCQTAYEIEKQTHE